MQLIEEPLPMARPVMDDIEAALLQSAARKEVQRRRSDPGLCFPFAPPMRGMGFGGDDVHLPARTHRRCPDGSDQARVERFQARAHFLERRGDPLRPGLKFGVEIRGELRAQRAGHLAIDVVPESLEIDAIVLQSPRGIALDQRQAGPRQDRGARHAEVIVQFADLCVVGDLRRTEHDTQCREHGILYDRPEQHVGREVRGMLDAQPLQRFSADGLRALPHESAASGTMDRMTSGLLVEEKSLRRRPADLTMVASRFQASGCVLIGRKKRCVVRDRPCQHGCCQFSQQRMLGETNSSVLSGNIRYHMRAKAPAREAPAA